MAKVSNGRTSNGMLAFASTVVRSETGSDFQNRMLRSRRSPWRASRHRRCHDKKGAHDQQLGEVVRLRDHVVLLHRVERGRGTHLVRQMNVLITKPNRIRAATASGAI